MITCTNCGTALEGSVKYCPSCGTGTPASRGTPVSTGAPASTGMPAATGTDEGKTMSILAYILFFVPLPTGAHRRSDAVRFHTNQRTVLFIAGCIYGVAYAILTGVLVFIPIVGWILIMLLGMGNLGIVALCIIGIVNAVQNQCKPLPLIGKFTIIK